MRPSIESNTVTPATPAAPGEPPNTKKTSPFSPVSLPCGRVVKNRLAKVAMYEHLALFYGGPPNPYHFSLYSEWARNDWGIILTGNVQVSQEHLTLGRDIVIPKTISEESLAPFKTLADMIHGISGKVGGEDITHPGGPALAIMQLSHAGRQAANFIGGRPAFEPPLAPSPIRVGFPAKSNSTSHKSSNNWASNAMHRLLFPIPREMSLGDIDDVVAGFVRGAKVALDSGFDGVQLHVAHGYLLAQFASPKSNIRTDQYSSDPENALRLVHRIARSIRAIVPKEFVLGVKLNAGDYTQGSGRPGTTGVSKEVAPEDRALHNLSTIASWKIIDFIEVSGGDYENPEFMQSAPSSGTSPRQVFFARFSQRAVEYLATTGSPDTNPLILLTGGLRTPAHVYSALSSNHAHLLGFGRGSVLRPDLPEVLVNRERNPDPQTENRAFAPEPDLSVSNSVFGRWPLRWVWPWIPKVTLIGAGLNVAWYEVGLRQMALWNMERARRPKLGEFRADYNMGGVEALMKMYFWVYGGDSLISLFYPYLFRLGGILAALLTCRFWYSS